MNAAGCPTDRGELLSLLTDRPPEHLARHVRDCTVCTEELAELRAAQSLIPLTLEGAPSERVRAHVMAHAERAVSTGRHLPWVGSSRERATIVAAVAAFAAVGLGQVRGAFPGVGATTLGVAALLLAVLWALALQVFARPTRWVEHRALIGSSLAAVGVFSLVALLIPVPTAARYCAEILFGGFPSRPDQIAGLYLGAAALHAAVSTSAGRLIVGIAAPGALLAGPLLFTTLAGPTLFLQVAAEPVLVAAATFCGCLCGALLGGLFVRSFAVKRSKSEADDHFAS